ncbi:hypothetical protein [Intrasporangium sp.]|uniref:hypothetical protein n=1 Tax=Intrasporangium sp. TaxID=1925024 RepID=UPI0033653E2B
MNDLNARILEETLHERAGSMPLPVPAGVELIDRAGRKRRRRAAVGTLAGAATAAVAVVAFLGIPSPAPERPVRPASSQAPSTSASESPVRQRPLSIDDVARVNRVHDWAIALPPGPAVKRDLGYRAWREDGHVVLQIGGRTVPLAERVQLLSHPTKVADGWLFAAHDSTSLPATRVLHVGTNLGVTVVAEADEVRQVVAGPGGRGFAVVTVSASRDEIMPGTVTFFSAEGRQQRHLELPGWQEPLIATWHGDVVTFPAPGGSPTRLRSYDLRTGQMSDVRLASSQADVTDVRVLTIPGAWGGDPAAALVAVERSTGVECAHLIEGADIAPQPILCGPSDASWLIAKVSPDGTKAIIGDRYYERFNMDRPTRLIDLGTMTDVAGVPPEVLAVGVGHLYWENEHVLIGGANRVAPVHRSEALFRWNLSTSTGEALEWRLADSPVAGYTPGTPDEPAVWP